VDERADQRGDPEPIVEVSTRREDLCPGTGGHEVDGAGDDERRADQEEVLRGALDVARRPVELRDGEREHEAFERRTGAEGEDLRRGGVEGVADAAGEHEQHDPAHAGNTHQTPFRHEAPEWEDERGQRGDHFIGVRDPLDFEQPLNAVFEHDEPDGREDEGFREFDRQENAQECGCDHAE